MINDDLADAILTRELNLNRFDAELRRRVSEKLSKMDKDILKELQGDITTWNRAYFNEKLRDLRKLIDDYYVEIADMTAQDMADLSESEMNWLVSEVNDLVGTDLFVKPTKDPEKLSFESLVQGATLASWWLKLSADAYFRVSTQMRIGYGIGDKTVAEKVKAQLKTNKSSASTIVTNATRTVASDTRNVVYLKNTSKIAGKKYVAVLDNRTSLGCIAYDGSTYTMDNKPIGKKSLPYRELPAHFNCRSVYVVYLKEAKYLEDIPPSTRSSMDGQVPATMNFAEFLDRKGKAFQDEVLGKGKAQLWREGKITLQQLIDQSGNPVTLKELDK